MPAGERSPPGLAVRRGSRPETQEGTAQPRPAGTSPRSMDMSCSPAGNAVARAVRNPDGEVERPGSYRVLPPDRGLPSDRSRTGHPLLDAELVWPGRRRRDRRETSVGNGSARVTAASSTWSVATPSIWTPPSCGFCREHHKHAVVVIKGDQRLLLKDAARDSSPSVRRPSGLWPPSHGPVLGRRGLHLL